MWQRKATEEVEEEEQGGEVEEVASMLESHSAPAKTLGIQLTPDATKWE